VVPAFERTVTDHLLEAQMGATVLIGHRRSGCSGMRWSAR